MLNETVIDSLSQPQNLLSIAAILVAIIIPLYIAYRSHQIRRPKLLFDAGYSVLRGAKVDSAATRHVIFAVSDLPVHAHSVAMPCYIENKSSQSVNDVNIEIDIPKSFYIESKNLWSLLDDLGSSEFIPHFFRASRFASDLGDYVRIHYKLGSIHPQTSISMSEILNLEESNSQIQEAIFPNGFGHIVESIHKIEEIKYFCYLKFSCYAENVTPTRKYIYFRLMRDNFVPEDWLDKKIPLSTVNANVKRRRKISSRNKRDNLSQYIAAFWFGMTGTSVSFCPFVPFRSTGMAKTEKCEIIRLPDKTEYKVKKRSNEAVTVASTKSLPENVLVLDILMPRRIAIDFPIWVNNFARLSVYHGCLNCAVMREMWRSLTRT